MRLLLPMTSTSAFPLYLLPDWLLNRFPRLQRHPRANELKWMRPGTGWVDQSLFTTGAYQGEEFNFLLAGVINGQSEINWKRVDQFIATGRSFEAFHGINVNEYASHADLSLNLADADEHVRRSLGVQIELSARMAACQPTIFNIHAGAVPGVAADQQIRRRGLDVVATNVRAILPLLERHEMLFALENGFDVLDGHSILGGEPWELEYLLEQIDHPLVGATFDWGHANIQATLLAARGQLDTGPAWQERFLHAFVDRLGDGIVYAHLHYNDAHTRVADVREPVARWTRGKDHHAPMTRIPEAERQEYAQLLHRLAAETSIWEHGTVHAELVRRRVFVVMVAMPEGAERRDFLDSARFIRQAMGPVLVSEDVAVEEPVAP